MKNVLKLITLLLTISSSLLLNAMDGGNNSIVHTSLDKSETIESKFSQMKEGIKELVTHNESLLKTEISEGLRKVLSKKQNNIVGFLDLAENDSTNLKILFKIFPLVYEGTSNLVSDLAEFAQKETPVNDHLEKYYTTLGKLSIVNSKVKAVNKAMKELEKGL